MQAKAKWAAFLAGTALFGAVLTGDAYADPPSPSQPDTEQAGSKLTPGEAEVMSELIRMHKAHREQFKKEAQTVIKQAVKDGKITQEQADKLLDGKLHKNHHRQHEHKAE